MSFSSVAQMVPGFNQPHVALGFMSSEATGSAGTSSSKLKSLSESWPMTV